MAAVFHTPWETDGIQIYNALGRKVGRAHRASGEDRAAVTALWTAAPALYEALKEAADMLEACERRLRQNGSFEQAKVVDEQVGKARAALASASGHGGE
jgi:hypothetical protein